MIAEFAVHRSHWVQEDETLMPLFSGTLQEAGVLKLMNALCEVEGHLQLEEIRQRAQEMCALAEQYGVRLEEVERNWIRYTPRKDLHSLPAFSRWCECVHDLEERTFYALRLCPHCHGQAAQRLTDQLYCCTACGGVVTS